MSSFDNKMIVKILFSYLFAVFALSFVASDQYDDNVIFTVYKDKLVEWSDLSDSR